MFNYDTKLIVGRDPLIKEKETLTADLRDQAQILADTATEALEDAVEALTQVKQFEAVARAKENEIQVAKGKISSKASSISDLASSASMHGTKAAQQAAIAGTSEAYSKAKTAQSKAKSVQSKAISASSKKVSAADIACKATASSIAATTDLADAESLTATAIQEKVKVDHLAVIQDQKATEAAAEARLEEDTYPHDPYPTDPTVYFGKGYVKVIEGSGSPVLYKEDKTGEFIPVTDNGSYTNRVYKTETGYQLVTKNKAITEFSSAGTGILPLSAQIDTNGNTTEFSREKDVLTITDPTGRQTIVQYAAGYIGEITDPEGNKYTYSYEDKLLKNYTDPGGYVWSYVYDENNRLISRIDPENNSYQYVYDLEGRVIQEIDKKDTKLPIYTILTIK